MTNDSANVNHLTSCDLVLGAPAAPPKRRPRKPSLASALKAARKAGADRVEILDNKIVIPLASDPAKPKSTSTAASDSVANEWDDLLLGGDDGAH
jgi:hypothetical protein